MAMEGFLLLQNLSTWTYKYDRIFPAIYLPLPGQPGCVALHEHELWKHGADEAAADRRQQSHSGKSIM